MRKLNKWLATLLAVLLVAGCLPLGALAAEDSELPYGITSEQEIAVTQVDEENSCLDGIEEEAYQRSLGVVAQEIVPGFPSPKTWGRVLSPFTITATKEDPTVAFTMTAPTLSNNEESFADTYGLAYKVAVQDADDPSAPVMFFAATVDEDNNSVTATIPVGSETKLCALVQVDTANLTKNVTYSAQNQVAMPESIYENADGSVLHFSWTYQLDSSKTPGGLGMFGFDASYYEVNLNLGSLVLDPDTVQVTSETYSNGTPTEWKEGTGYWTIPLEVTDTDEESVCKPYTISFDCTIPASEFVDTDSVMPMAEFVFDVYHNGPGSNLKPALSISDAAPLTSSTLLLPAVTITPADLTIYQGGDEGYEGVYGDEAIDLGSNSLPHPLFKITAPSGTGIDPKDLTFTTGEGDNVKTWTVECDNPDSEGEKYYHFEAGKDQQPVRVTYTDSKGKKVLSDEFDPATIGDVYAEYEIALYPGENDFSKIKASADRGNTSYPISVNTGKLTVRAVAKDDPTSDVVTEISSSVAAGSATAVAPADTKYTLNNTGVQLPAGSAPSLLFDNIIEDKGSTERTKALQAKVDETLGKAETTRHYQAKYLDLVDANNGNAWIKASGDVDIYWGYPQGTDSTTEFKLLHFTGLHRDGEESGFEVEDIAASTIEEINVINDTNGIKFSVSSGGFSPFVLVWEDKPEPEPTPPPYIPPVDDDDDQPEDPDDTGVSDLLNTEDHDQYLFGYPDGTFGPGLNMTRAEAAQMFYNLLVDQDVTAKPVFDDVPEGAWYAEPVNVMAKLDIVEGVGDNKFEPNREITRAEFTAMAMRFAEGETGGKNIFSDVDEDDWFYDVVVDSIKYGWIEGYPDGTFRPQNLITREEVTTIVNRMLGRLPDEKFIDAHEDDLDLFPDVTKNWAYYDVVEATNDHQYKKTSSGEDWTKLG